MVLPSDAPNSPSNAIIEWREDNGCDAWALFIPDAADTQSELAVLEGSMQRLKKQASHAVIIRFLSQKIERAKIVSLQASRPASALLGAEQKYASCKYHA